MGQKSLEYMSLMLGNQTLQRQYMLYIKSFIRYCTSLSSKVCGTVNTMGYYYSCAVRNCVALVVSDHTRGAKDKQTTSASRMKNVVQDFISGFVFFSLVV